jgi:hypothetical protein
VTADDEYEDELMPLYQLVLSFPTNVGDTPPKIRLQYDASDPEAMAANPTWPDTPFLLPEEGLIRIWRRADTVLDRSAAEAGWTSGPQGDFVVPGVGYTEEDLEGEAFDEDGVVTLYIQGVRAGVGTVQFWLDVDGDGPGGFALADEVKYTALDIDIIGNSLNMEGFDPSEALAGAYGPMTAALAEQMENNPAANPLAMIVIVNDNDDDGDGIIDWADGFNLDGSLTPNADDRTFYDVPAPAPDKGDKFLPLLIVIDEKALADERARIRITYDASPPGSVLPSTPNRLGEEPTFSLPQNGVLRLWTKDGDVPRSKQGIDGGALDPNKGYFVPPREYGRDDWGKLGIGPGPNNNVIKLFAEAVKLAAAPTYTTPITVELALDGVNFVKVQHANAIVRPVRIGLDVNANGILDEAVDGVMNYLPGYEGATAKVSTGTTYKTTQYAGQQMGVMVEGLGAGVDGVLFRIAEVTNHDGYAGNVTDAGIKVVGNRNDFSFYQHTDLPEGVTDPKRNIRAASLAQSSWWVPLWAKDYGGWARIEVSVVVGQKATVIHTFTIPNDADNDTVGDKWERWMVADWIRLYGPIMGTALGFFDGKRESSDDREPEDPDGDTGLLGFGGVGEHGPNSRHRTSGDGRNFWEEYRGHILDGGGHYFLNPGKSHPGGHIRLSPVIKELLVEVDAMGGIAHLPAIVNGNELPRRAAIVGWMNEVARGESRGAGFMMYYVLDDVNTPTVGGPGYFRTRASLHAYMSRQRNLGNGIAGGAFDSSGTYHFTHLVFVSYLSPTAGQNAWATGGQAEQDRQAAVGVDWLFTRLPTMFGVPPPQWSPTFDLFVASVVSHELHHTYAWDIGGGGGHVRDTDGDGVPGQPSDFGYLLYDYMFNRPGYRGQDYAGIRYGRGTTRHIVIR